MSTTNRGSQNFSFNPHSTPALDPQSNGNMPLPSTESDFWREVGVIAIQLQEDRAEDLRGVSMWLYKLRSDLWQARRMATEWSRLIWMVHELIRTDFCPQRFEAAEAWILRGSWHPKKTFLTLDDFFPTVYQLETLCGVAIITVSAHRKAIQSAVNESRESGRREERALHAIGNVAGGADDASLATAIDAERRKTTVALLEAAQERADIHERLVHSTRELERLRRRNESLESELEVVRHQLKQMTIRLSETQ